ncbi:MAG: hypothetical protein H0V84_12495 [Actinobacteria bacterium]|nr:hypothetical protein [Actinomycetota bacterium]
MSTTPSSPPPDKPGGYGYSARGGNPLAGMPLPINPELLIWALVVIIVAVITLASDAVNASGFVTAMTALTVGYLLSRGIAKASRVLEH